VQLRLLVQPAVNLALVHNAVPLVQAVQVVNGSGRPLEDVSARVELDGRGRGLVEPWTATLVQGLAEGDEQTWMPGTVSGTRPADAGGLRDLGDLVPAYDHLEQLNESHRATVTATLTHRWGDPLTLAVPVQVLAHNEWFNDPLFYESLAAFAQPNTRAVTDVLDGAATLLEQRPGGGSLCGYQQGPEHASLIAAAVYESLRNRTIRYINPPASFEGTGQKIRTVAQVLDERFGTCLDLSVAYAACLEQAGLNPVLWLVDGHAFAGYLRDDEATIGRTVVVETNALANLVESGRVVPVEAHFYDQEATGTFAAAVAAGRRRFDERDALHGAIDVRYAHRSGTRPLPSSDATPAHASGGGGEPGATAGAASPDTTALDLPPELLARPDEDDVLLDGRDDAPPRVQQWKRALLDLSTRNRLLNLRPGNEVVDVHVPPGSLPLLDDLVHADKAITLLAQDELSDLHQLQGARRAQDLDVDVLTGLLQGRERTAFVAVTQAAYARRMRNLQRTARTMLEETGNANLYLTFGALVHRTPTGKEARAPLFLLPVKVEGRGGREPFQIRLDSSNVASPNLCLVEWLRAKHGVQIEALETPKLDRSGIDLVAVLPAIRDALLTHHLDLRVDEVATLAICQFSTFGMWRDLDQHWDLLAQSPVVEHLALRPGETFRDPEVEEDDDVPLDAVPVDEARLPVPIPADGSQLRAVALAAQGRSFVLEGPPGTGKSQTITNLIAHALEHGKSVLFVAEKQAALDVVKKRLDQVGLADFSLDLHGRSQRPVEIRAQLKRAVDNVAAYDRRGWDAIQARVRSRLAPLAEYPDRVHARNGVGVSLWSAYENLCQYGDGPIAPIPAAYVATERDEEPVKDALRDFARAARTAGLRPRHPWAIVGRVGDDLDATDLVTAAQGLEEARRRLSGAPVAPALLEALPGPRALDALLPHLDDRVAGTVPDRARLDEVRSSAWRTRRRQLTDELVRFPEQHGVVLSTFAPAFLEHGDASGLVAAAEVAQKGMFGKRKRAEQFAATVTPLLTDGATLDPPQVPGLLMGLDAARTHAEQLTGQARDLLGDLVPGGWTPLRADAATALASATERLERSDRFQREHPELWEIVERAGVPATEDVGHLRDVLAGWNRWLRLVGADDGELRQWADGRPWTEAWAQDGPVWARETADSADAPVRRWSRMVAFLDPLHDAGLDALRVELLTTELDAAEAEVAYMRGVATTSLRERREAAGLQGFDGALRDGEVEDYATAAADSRREQTVALPAGLLEQRPFRGDRLTGRVGELRRRLDAKRGGLAIRQLIERYGDLIVQATPCFFVSPASLAQFVAPGAITFDIVVFDEASQVTVAQAIGALGRGRSAVVVGDSQQMPPTSVGKVKATEQAADGTGHDGDDEEDVPLEDLESILSECVESQLPRIWLSWHYRSQEESLIAFSNAHYYEGRLASLPSPGGDPTAGVELRRVDGHFNREDRKDGFRTNRVEAEAIVAEIRERLADPHRSAESIGVVTFNLQQRELVLNLLEECDDPRVARQLREDAPEGIFVKNLENVQGDERDVILFSVAFSKKPDGGPLPLNFGPLTATGGEKRLNVAVTRARRKVVLFASFDPADIDLARTSSKGMAHLRAYLEVAAHGAQSLEPVSGRSVVGIDQVREAIAEALRERGLEVQSDYGLSDFSLDLVVRRPGRERWQVAILLDGPRWRDRPTAADRDLTPRLLEPMMHWGAALRVWLPQWLDDRDAVLRRVEEAVDRAQEREEQLAAERERAANAEPPQAEDDTAEAPADEDLIEVETFVPAGDEHPSAATAETRPLVAGGADPPPPDVAPTERDPHACGVPYAETPPTALGTRDDLARTSSPTVRATITAAVRETIEVEGPIELTRLARSIGRRFGLDRVSTPRRAFILEHVPSDLVRGTDLGDFAWPATLDPGTWRGYRTTPEGFGRPLGEIAPEEILNAMAAVVADQVLTDDEAMFRATLAIFDQRRLTPQSQERLKACLVMGRASRRLVRVEGTGRWVGA